MAIQRKIKTKSNIPTLILVGLFLTVTIIAAPYVYRFLQNFAKHICGLPIRKQIGELYESDVIEFEGTLSEVLLSKV